MINDEIKEIAARIGKALSPKKIYLFGSFARGDSGKYSDYDFYVVMPDGSGNIIDLIQKAHASLIGLKNRRRGADILVGFESSFAEQKNYIEKEVLEDGVIVYAGEL